MSRVVRTLVGLWLALLAMSADIATAGKAAGATKAKKGKKPTKADAQQEASNLLYQQGDAVENCAGKKALDKGASKVEVYTKVTVNSKGQVVNIVTSVTVDKSGYSEDVKQCVDLLIRGLKFPPIAAPLTTIERTWTIATS